MPNISTSLSPVNNFRIDYVQLLSPLGLVLDVTTEIINFTMVETIDDITSGTIILQNRSNLTGILKNLTGQEALKIAFASGDGNKGGVRKTIGNITDIITSKCFFYSSSNSTFVAITTSKTYFYFFLAS